MTAKEIDYFRMLDLDAEQAKKMGADALRDKVRSKKKEWTMRAANPLFQQEARGKLDQIRGFESLVNDSDALAAYARQIADQQRLRRKDEELIVGRLARIAIGNRKTITPAQQDLLIKLAENEGIAQSLVDSVLNRLKISVGDQLPAVKDSPSIPYLKPALDRTILLQIRGWLAALDCESFYELLDVPADSPVSAILSNAKFLYERWSRVLPKSSECVAWEKSLQACMTYLKDEPSKKRYDAALTNLRIDELIQSIDLVLASGDLSKESQMELARLGMRQWGFSTAMVDRCVRARAAKMEIGSPRPVAISMRMQGQIECRRCCAWSPTHNAACWHCGCSLTERCKNPACRRKLTGSSRRCDHCALPLAEGVKFAEFLNAADADLACGKVASALVHCRQARRILPTPEVAGRIEYAGKILAQCAVARNSFSVRALSSTHDSLVKLAELAPGLRVPGVPRISQLAAEMETQQRRIRAANVDSNVLEFGKVLSDVLSRWTDCQIAFQKLWTCCETLAAKGQCAKAVRYARQIRSIRSSDRYVSDWADQMEKKLVDSHQDDQQLEQARLAFESAIEDNRLYAAKKWLKHLASGGKARKDDVEILKEKFHLLSRQLSETRSQAEAAPTRADSINHYRSLLNLYPDCREAIDAIQQATPVPPEPPAELPTAHAKSVTVPTKCNGSLIG